VTQRNQGASFALAGVVTKRLDQLQILARIDQFLRITVGTDAECTALIAALRNILR